MVPLQLRKCSNHMLFVKIFQSQDSPHIYILPVQTGYIWQLPLTRLQMRPAPYVTEVTDSSRQIVKWTKAACYSGTI